MNGNFKIILNDKRGEFTIYNYDLKFSKFYTESNNLKQ